MITLDCDEIARLMEAMEIDQSSGRTDQQQRMDIAAQTALDECVAMYGDAMTMPVIKLLRGVLDRADVISDDNFGRDN